MSSISIQINDKILQRVGLVAIKNRFQKELEYLYYEEMAEEINKSLFESGIDNDHELESARQKAWEQYKSEFLNGIVK